MTGKKSTIANRANHRPKSKLEMKAFLLRILCSRLGWLVKLLISGIVAGITLGLSKLGIELDDAMRNEIATFSASLTYIAIQSAVLKAQLNGSEKIQEALAEIFPNVRHDRINGMKDLARINVLVEEVKDKHADGSPILAAIPTNPNP